MHANYSENQPITLFVSLVNDSPVQKVNISYWDPLSMDKIKHINVYSIKHTNLVISQVPYDK